MNENKPRPVLNASTVRRLSVAASCDPRTIRRAAAGEPIRGMSGERARAALRAEGFDIPEPHVPDAESPGQPTPGAAAAA